MKEGIIVIQVPLVFPLQSDKDVLGPVASAIREHGSSIKIASFSHIDSCPGFILPVKQLVSLCHDANIRAFIDGAHAIGKDNFCLFVCLFLLLLSHQLLHCTIQARLRWMSLT